MHDIADWKHRHDYRSASQERSEKRTLWVIALTTVTMLVELVAGTLTGSMALLADGWHMATHVGALSITAFAYYMTRRHAENPRFTFGTGKIATLGGYTSAVALGLVALLIAVESFSRLIEPETVFFREAMMVAWVGLLVNLISAWLLRHDDHHHHHGHDHHHHDHNLRAAYMHVLADALTSVLAIIALWTGSQYGWVWMDPIMGIVGAIVIARWAIGLLKDSGKVLLDAEDHDRIKQEVYRLVEADTDARVADLHVWRVGPGSLACIVSIVTHDNKPLAYYKDAIARLPQLEHLTIEINLCTPEVCPAVVGSQGRNE